MKTPISSYQKIYDQFLIGEFPEIDYVVVSCQHLLRQLQARMKELNKYLGDRRNVEVNIYFEGELLCHDVNRTSDIGPM